MRKIHTILIIAVATVFLSAAVSVYYFIFTVQGSVHVAKFFISKYAGSKSVYIKSANGALSRKLSLLDVEIKDLRIFPAGNSLKVQKIDIRPRYFNLPRLDIDVFNARLEAAGLEQIVFHGGYHGGHIDFNLYSNNMDICRILNAFIKKRDLKNLSGRIRHLDVYAKGRASEPALNGEFKIERLLYNDVLLADCFGVFAVVLKYSGGALRVDGDLTFNSGTISKPKAAVIELQESKILFSGDPARPQLNLNGVSVVGTTKIKIALKGSIDKPELRLTSEPSIPQEWLLVMLVTGESFKGAEQMLNNGQIPADIAKDFIDYFFFAGSGSRMAQALGIDISLQYDGQTKGLGVKKTIFDKVGASYGIEQPQVKEGPPATTHKIGGDYKITDSLSIGAEREIKQDKKTVAPAEEAQTQTKEPKTNDKIFLKYKKAF